MKKLLPAALSLLFILPVLRCADTNATLSRAKAKVLLEKILTEVAPTSESAVIKTIEIGSTVDSGEGMVESYRRVAEIYRDLAAKGLIEINLEQCPPSGYRHRKPYPCYRILRVTKKGQASVIGTTNGDDPVVKIADRKLIKITGVQSSGRLAVIEFEYRYVPNEWGESFHSYSLVKPDVYDEIHKDTVTFELWDDGWRLSKFSGFSPKSVF